MHYPYRSIRHVASVTFMVLPSSHSLANAAKVAAFGTVNAPDSSGSLVSSP